MDIGHLLRNQTQLSTIFLGTHKFFPIFLFYHIFVSIHILSQSSTMGHAKRTNEQFKWTKYYDFICKMPGVRYTAHSSRIRIHLRLVRLIESQMKCVFVVHRSISVPRTHTRTHLQLNFEQIVRRHQPEQRVAH